jgi:hypothetical protein
MSAITYQNIVNTPNPVWTSFPTTITVTGTGATGNPPNGFTLNSYYLQIGKLLHIYMQYTQYQVTNANNGTGCYLFNLPSGFTANTKVIPAYSNNPYNYMSQIGSSSVNYYLRSTTTGGVAVLWDATHYALLNYWNAQLMGSLNFYYTRATWQCWTALLAVPIM